MYNVDTRVLRIRVFYMYYVVTMLTDIQRKRRLTKHFTYEEMTHTDTHLPNDPEPFELHNLLYTCRILESVRNKFGYPIPITSGYRTKIVNNEVGGSLNSYHQDGRAVDIDISSMSSGKADRLESLLWSYNPIELIRYNTKHIIHVAF